MSSQHSSKQEMIFYCVVTAIVSGILCILCSYFIHHSTSDEAIKSDVFIGIMATLIGASVTIVIGYQIINAIHINQRLKEGDDRFQQIEKQGAKYFQLLQRSTTELIIRTLISELLRLNNDLTVSDLEKAHSEALVLLDLVPQRKKLDSYKQNLKEFQIPESSRVRIWDLDKYMDTYTEKLDYLKKNNGLSELDEIIDCIDKKQKDAYENDPSIVSSLNELMRLAKFSKK